MPKRVQFTLPENKHRLLKLWAAWHGKKPGAYAEQIISARIEANLDVIKKLVEEEAASRGLKVADIEAEWLGEPDNDSE